MAFSSRVRKIIESQGVLKAGLYFLSILPEKIGCGIVAIFVFKNRIPDEDADGHHFFKILTALAQLDDAERETLVTYKGSGILRQFRKLFEKGYFCAIGSCEGKPGCVCWVKPPARHQQCFLIRRCFTVSSMRGKGLYPGTLRFIAGWLQKQGQEAPIVLIESSVFNYASVRGIIKAGFEKEKIAIMCFGIKIYLPA